VIDPPGAGWNSEPNSDAGSPGIAELFRTAVPQKQPSGMESIDDEKIEVGGSLSPEDLHALPEFSDITP
jgi:hypothetical protein